MKWLLLLVSILGFVAASNAAVYKCVDDEGKTYFSDRGCPKEYEFKEKQLTAEDKQRIRWEEEKERRAAEMKKWHVYEGGQNGLYQLGDKGTIPAVVDVLKAILKDPESLIMSSCEPIYTNGVFYRARCTYRAKNGFGGYGVFTKIFHFGPTREYLTTTEGYGRPLPEEDLGWERRIYD